MILQAPYGQPAYYAQIDPRFASRCMVCATSIGPGSALLNVAQRFRGHFTAGGTPSVSATRRSEVARTLAGVNGYYILPYTATAQPPNAWTMLASIDIQSTGAARAIATFANSAGSGTFDRSLYQDNNNAWHGYLYDGAERNATGGTVTVGPHVVALQCTGTALTVYADGVAGAAQVVTTGGYTGYSSPAALVLGYGGGGSGAGGAGGSASLTSDIALAMFAFFDSALRDAELIALTKEPYRLFSRPKRVVFMDAPAAGGAITGSIDLAITSTGFLTGTGALAGSVVFALTPSGLLAGTGALSGAIALSLAPVGALTGAGALGGVVSLSIAPTGALAGSGSLAGSIVMALAPTGSLTGTGALTASVPLVFDLTGVLADADSSAITGSVPLTVNVTGSMSGTGALTGAVSIDLSMLGLFSQSAGEDDEQIQEPAGRRTKRRLYVEIDGQIFPVDDISHARALLDRARESARAHVEQLTREKVSRETFRKVGKKPIVLSTPQISSPNPELREVVREARKAINEVYRSTALDAELALLLARRLAEEDEEEAILLLM